ncbi:hypothetical protein HS088_TW19G00090 [Tripterygium wilfordii]|uniref:Uncharacterized protein n=1 Tax=Tripterygium wilfordii TaxID=458696 RepID=A0A7J7C8P1_TRIWF|nr:hypothetical protein HS088_TW19G00090 [Tripterygium wilfordii]
MIHSENYAVIRTRVPRTTEDNMTNGIEVEHRIHRKVFACHNKQVVPATPEDISRMHLGLGCQRIPQALSGGHWFQVMNQYKGRLEQNLMYGPVAALG